MLPGLGEIQEGDGFQTHVAHIGDGYAHGEFLGHDRIAVPFLDGEGQRLDGGSVVLLHKLFGPAGLPEIALLIQQGLYGSYFMVSHRVFLLYSV